MVNGNCSLAERYDGRSTDVVFGGRTKSCWWRVVVVVVVGQLGAPLAGRSDGKDVVFWRKTVAAHSLVVVVTLGASSEG